MNFTLADIIGSFGVTLLLLAFFLSLFKKIPATGALYILLNIIGGSLACAASAMIHYYPFVVLEGAWALVSVIALVKLLAGRSN